MLEFITKTQLARTSGYDFQCIALYATCTVVLAAMRNLLSTITTLCTIVPFGSRGIMSFQERDFASGERNTQR